MEHSLFEAARNEPAVSYPLTVFLCGHDYGCRVCVRCIPDTMKVCSCELVMVREIEMLDYLVLAAEIVPERCVVGDS